MTDQLDFALAQLRHAYRQLVEFPVRKQRAFADGLIAPQIERLEKLQADLAALQASMVDRVPPTLYEAVKAKARREGVSIRTLILRLLKDWSEQ